MVQPGAGDVSAPADAPSPSAPVEVLEPWIVSRLRDPAGAARSDHDLNGHLVGSLPSNTPLTPAAVLVALAEREGGLNVILTRRADTLTRHSGQIAFPGGRAEPGEDAVEAALREAHEEIALEPGHVRVAGVGDPYRTVTGFEVTPVVGFLSPGFSLHPAEAEVAEIFEAPFAFLMDPANHQEHSHLESGRRFYAMPFGDRFVWGATAGMLRALSERLFGPAPAARRVQPT
jgi:8-oxo-dGTP pyrophosphatase MutT (NUDIX family)